MRVKRYVAADIRQAIRMVREEQGPDAVILSNKRIEEGVEIIAAVDYNPAELESAPIEDAVPSGPDVVQSGAVDSEVMQSNVLQNRGEGESRTLEEVQNEIRNIRSMLENQIRSPRTETASLSMRGRLYQRLLAMGLTSDISKSIAKEVDASLPEEQAWHAALDQFAKRIPLAPDHHFKRGGAVAFIGATGVGKTTTIAKIASRYILANDAKKVILVTSDNYRIGGHEQLKIYARILGLPLYVIHRQQELNEIMREAARDQLILIDTAGTKFKGLPTQQQFMFLKNCPMKIHTYLVLSATAQHSDLSEIVRSCQGFQINGCIGTKLDESTSLGGMLSVIIQNRLPLVYLADGQKVPDDISAPSLSRLVSKAVALSKLKHKEMQDEALALELGDRQGNEFL